MLSFIQRACRLSELPVLLVMDFHTLRRKKFGELLKVTEWPGGGSFSLRGSPRPFISFYPSMSTPPILQDSA